MNHKVDEYLSRVGTWEKELEYLRAIILSCGLNEDYKWMHPCYTFQNKNIVLIHEFKDYCAILFHKGALLKDKKNILIQQTENVQSARQIRFKNILEIERLETIIKEYIFEAIDVEKTGLKVELKKTSEYIIPEELKEKFKQLPKLKIAFEKLTPGKQRGYLLHFSKPKHSKTRTDRIEKNIDRILIGKGIMDCICGHSKRYPNCDGSHKDYE